MLRGKESNEEVMLEQTDREEFEVWSPLLATAVI